MFRQKQLPTLTKYWKTIHLQVGNCLPTVVLEVMVDTSLRNDADAASGDRVPTASVDREQDLPGWLSTIYQRIGRKRIWIIWQWWWHKTPPPHFQRDPGGKHNLFHFPKDRNCEICNRTKITRAPCRRKPTSREDRIPKATKIGGTITADHKVLNEENAIAPSICGSSTKFGYSIGTVLSVQKQECTRYGVRCAAILTSRKQSWSDLHW